jgi:hypothetical protein
MALVTAELHHDLSSRCDREDPDHDKRIELEAEREEQARKSSHR